MEPDVDEERPAPGKAVPLVLFFATVFTTLWAGAYQTNTNPMRGAWRFLREEPWALWQGIPFAVTVMAILVTHELGHYVLSRIHRVPASFPLFIPGTPHFVGTFGAVIRMPGPILSRKALFDIGVAGPIAGFGIAVIAMVVGLHLSRVAIGGTGFALHLGEPLIWQLATWLIIGPLPPNAEVIAHPIGVAAWFGLFLTSFNLIPIGQLDGGHVAYALWGSRQRTIAIAVLPVLVVLGLVGPAPTWFVLVGLSGLIGIAHPPVRDPHTELGTARVVVGWVALVIFLLTFVPVPTSFY